MQSFEPGRQLSLQDCAAHQLPSHHAASGADCAETHQPRRTFCCQSGCITAQQHTHGAVQPAYLNLLLHRLGALLLGQEADGLLIPGHRTVKMLVRQLDALSLHDTAQHSVSLDATWRPPVLPTPYGGWTRRCCPLYKQPPCCLSPRHTIIYALAKCHKQHSMQARSHQT